MNKLGKLGIMLAVPLIIWFIPAPEGLNPVAWRLVGFYLAAILGLMLKPIPDPLVLLTCIAGSSILLSQAKNVLVGYASTTTWLVFTAFSLSIAFMKTGLGHRIAYLLIGSFGKNVLRLGFVNAILDLIIAPVTPSNTARAAGIVLPIMTSVSQSLGSTPGETAKKAGSFLTANIYYVTLVTSIMFLTAQAPNLLAGNLVKQLLGVELSWGTWAIAMIVPGLVALFLTPIITYFIFKPTIKEIDNKSIARAGLEKLGPMKYSEKALIVIFILALLGWALPSLLSQFWGIKVPLDAISVALGAMVACFLLGVLKWDDMLENKAAWSTLLWYGGILGMSTALANLKFFDWLAKMMGASISFGDNPTIALFVISAISVVIRYVFASGSAYVVAMFPLFLTLAKIAHVDPMAMGLMIVATNAFGGTLTHYGSGPAPAVFGAGYNDVKTWWFGGAMIALMCFIVMSTVGMAWWKFIGLI